MKNKKTPLVHKYHPGGYIGWTVAILLLIALVIALGLYLLKEQESFDNEISGLNEVGQDLVERNHIRSFSEKIGAMTDKITTIKWNDYLLNEIVSLKYPHGFHLLSQEYFEPYGQEIIISKTPLIRIEGELDRDKAITISHRLIVDEVEGDQEVKQFIEDNLLDLNNTEEEIYTSASNLEFLHIMGEPKIAADLDQPSEIYTLLFRDSEGQLHHLLIMSIEIMNEPTLSEFVDTITLPSNFKQVKI